MTDNSLAVTKIIDLANPTRFLAFVERALPWFVGLTLLLFVVGLYLGFTSETDYQQGDTVRIMYVHVPAAWLSMMCYSVMALSAIGTLVWRHPLADVSHKAAAPLGAAFTLIALVTGSLWGKPMWGTWWVWDARLTSVLILFFLYLGYMALVNAFDDPTRGNKAGSILLLVGVVNVPIIKFSVEWWNTLHQPASVIRMDGPTISGEMLWPLFVMALAFKAWFVVTVILRMRAELAARRIQALRLTQAASATSAEAVAAE